MPYSNPLTQQVSQLIYNFIVAPLVIEVYSKEEKEIMGEIVSLLNTLEDKNSVLSHVGSTGETLFFDIISWSDEKRPSGDPDNTKLDRIIKLFYMNLSDEEWLYFITSTTEANFLYLLGMGAPSLITEILIQTTACISKQPAFEKELTVIANQLLFGEFKLTSQVVLKKQVSRIHAAVALDSIFKSSDTNLITRIFETQKIYPQFILQFLSDIEVLKQLACHLNNVDRKYADTFFKTTFNELAFDKKNLLTQSIVNKRPELFRFLLEECHVNPCLTGDFTSDDDCISFLLLKCCEQSGYYVFFDVVFHWLDGFIQNYNKDKNPDRLLRHPYQRDANFCPLVFILTHQGEHFLKFLMKHIEIDWLKLLTTRHSKPFPLWIPYINPYYSFDKSDITDYVDATRHTKKWVDSTKLIQALVQSILILDISSTSDITEKRVLYILSKQILNNVLNHTELFQLFIKHQRNPIDPTDNSLQQLHHFSEDENIKSNLKFILKELSNTKIIPLITMYSFLSVLNKQSNEQAVQMLLGFEQFEMFLSSILGFLERILKAFPATSYLNQIIVHYGYDKLDLPLWTELKRMTKSSEKSSLSYKEKLAEKLTNRKDKEKKDLHSVSCPSVESKTDSPEHSLEMRINWLQFTLDGSSTKPIKNENIDVDLKAAAKDLTKYHGEKLQQFTKDLKQLKEIRKKYIEIDGNLELKPVPQALIKRKKLKNKNINPKDTPKGDPQSAPHPILIDSKIPECTILYTTVTSPPPEPEVQQSAHEKVKDALIASKKCSSVQAVMKNKSAGRKKKIKTLLSTPHKINITEPEIDTKKITAIQLSETQLNNSDVTVYTQEQYEVITQIEPNIIIPSSEPLKTTLLTIWSPCPQVNPLLASMDKVLKTPPLLTLSQEDALRVYTSIYFKQMVLDLGLFINSLSFQQAYTIIEPFEFDAIQSTKLHIYQLISFIQSEFAPLLNQSEQVDLFPNLEDQEIHSEEQQQDPWMLKTNTQTNKVNILLTIFKAQDDKDLIVVDKLTHLNQQLETTKTNSFSKSSTVYHLWNQFISSHIHAFSRLQTYFEALESTNIITKQLPHLLNTLHHSFLPTRYKTSEEQEIHTLFLKFPQFLNTMLSYAHLGACIETDEVGSQVFGYFENIVRSDTDFYTQVHLNNPEDFEHLIGYVANCITENCSTNDLAKLAYQSESSILWVLTLNGHKIDWIIDTKPFIESIDARRMPVAMLSYNPFTGTVFNPANTFEIKKLIKLSHYKDGLLYDIPSQALDDWVSDTTKMPFILRMLAKIYKIYPLRTFDNLQLSSLLRNTALNFDYGQQDMSQGNILTTLLGQKSLLLAGLHHRLFVDNLVFIFGLSIEKDLDFLSHIQHVFQVKESEQPGWSRPCFLQFTSVDYIAMMGHRLLHNLLEDVDNTSSLLEKQNCVRALVSKCLRQPWADQAYRLVLQIELYLHDQINNIPQVFHIFDLKSFYKPKVALSHIPCERPYTQGNVYCLFRQTTQSIAADPAFNSYFNATYF
ncbi:MAG: hypothetical protein H0U75_09020 [Legionella sp.]|nr:hypothetical protein [Legionella sp.]